MIPTTVKQTVRLNFFNVDCAKLRYLLWPTPSNILIRWIETPLIIKQLSVEDQTGTDGVTYYNTIIKVFLFLSAFVFIQNK